MGARDWLVVLGVFMEVLSTIYCNCNKFRWVSPGLRMVSNELLFLSSAFVFVERFLHTFMENTQQTPDLEKDSCA